MSKEKRDKQEDKSGNKNETKGLEKKYEELEERYKRALADYQNLLKQTAREKEEFAKYAAERFLHDILPVYDNLKMAIEHHEEGSSWLEGVKYVVKQFKTVLEGMGVSEVKAENEKFSHETMEAIESQDTKDKKQDGVVARVLRPGYILHDKVIIPAKVVVYRYKDANNKESASEDKKKKDK